MQMGIFANKPRFTVIDKNPSPTKTVSNFGFVDYLEMTTVTGASVPVGYLAGGRCGLRGPSVYTAGLIGLMGGFMFAYQSSAGRLMGLFPNQEEVDKYKK